MIISVINMSEGGVTDAQLHNGIRAVNRQITYDFAPYWGFGAQLRLEGKAGRGDGFDQADMRGDAVLYIRRRVRRSQDDGFHASHFGGIPYGFVYLDVAEKLDESWTVTLSHEALELVGDPELNLLVRGPHPTADREVFHWFEVCDAVQDERYTIDGIGVSNFVLPLYFTSTEERGGRNDFLGTRPKTGSTPGRTLRSFSANPGGYITFFDPKTGKDRDWSPPKSRRSLQRLAVKKLLGVGRGHRRRQRAAEEAS
jgi:hypothetical protein